MSTIKLPPLPDSIQTPQRWCPTCYHWLWLGIFHGHTCRSPNTELGDEKCECDVCCGKGWNWEEHQVAERKSDVQTLKIHCDKCEGTGYELG